MSDVVPWLAAAGLLALSAFFSSSETALFRLGRSRKKARRIGPAVARLLDHPRELLVTVLLANLTVNLLFFALVPLLFRRQDTGGAVALGLTALVALLVFGEILPKTIALRAPELVARIVALPLGVVVVALTPVRRVVVVCLEVLLRAVGEAERVERAVTTEALAAALEKSAQEGVLRLGEADLLADIVELGALRVREIMTPRVDMIALDLAGSAEDQAAALREAERRRLTWLPVFRGDADQVVGRVEVRDLYAHPERPLEAQVMPVKFVPEVANVLTMMQTLRAERVAEAVVVDEWGGTAGIVTLEDLFEEIVGELRVEEETLQKPVIPLGEGRFRVSGTLSIREWNDLLGTDIVPNAFETVGGYVAVLLGRLPRPGDRVAMPGGLAGVVNEVRGRRVHTLDLFVEPRDGEAAA